MCLRHMPDGAVIKLTMFKLYKSKENIKCKILERNMKKITCTNM